MSSSSGRYSTRRKRSSPAAPVATSGLHQLWTSFVHLHRKAEAAGNLFELLVGQCIIRGLSGLLLLFVPSLLRFRLLLNHDRNSVWVTRHCYRVPGSGRSEERRVGKE